MLGDPILAIVPWSRLFDDEEVLCALNTDADQPRGAWVVIDHDLHVPGDEFVCAYSTDPAQIGQKIAVEDHGPIRCVRLDLPPAGFVIFEESATYLKY